jgi:hypothetical protein
MCVRGASERDSEAYPAAMRSGTHALYARVGPVETRCCSWQCG